MTSAYVVGDSATVFAYGQSGPDLLELAGKVEVVDREWDLALVSLPDHPLGKDYEPIEFSGTHDLKVGQDVDIYAEHLGDYSELVVNADIVDRVFGLDGAEWMRLDSPIYPDSIGALVDSKIWKRENGIGMVVNKTPRGWDNDGYTYALTGESIMDRLDYLKRIGNEAPTPASFPDTWGSWEYRSRNCRPDISSCVEVMYGGDRIRLNAVDHAQGGITVGDPMAIEFGCHADGILNATIHLPGYTGDGGGALWDYWVWVDGERTEKAAKSGVFAYGNGYGESSLNQRDVLKLGRLLRDTELADETVDIGTVTDIGAMVGVFDPSGFLKSYLEFAVRELKPLILRLQNPPAGSWTISGEMVIVGIEQMAHRRTREDISDWILEDTASVAGKIARKRDLLEEFLNRRARRPRKLLGLL